ncbi:MAG TPA: hypothetical protein VFO10_01305 [Oligoflexus sp.]|uniref:hypothetical protein n=1 Tax=Oligoflexus sp. TaxID=1971216 RepID=UPI002D7FB63D|nr:hypothetical protein [Oligoflexus sp.]HET9235854.1 hypothetical protein [Oligoflexus sp.]
MFKRVLALSLTAVLASTSALAAGPESTDAEQLQGVVTGAKDTLSALKFKFQGVPGISYQGQAVVVDLGTTANAYDKEILEKQLPRIENYLVNAGLKLGDAALKLPSNEGVTIFYQGCAETLRAQRQVAVAQGKAKYSLNFTTDDFSSVLADIEDALAVSNCR